MIPIYKNASHPASHAPANPIMTKSPTKTLSVKVSSQFIHQQNVIMISIRSDSGHATSSCLDNMTTNHEDMKKPKP